MKSDTKRHLRNFLIIAITVFITGLGIILVTKDEEIKSSQLLPISAETEINNQKIELEVAATKKEQDTGLMYRTSLPNNRGMLFKFKSPQKVSCWMKNCQISLDMIFLRDGVVEVIELSAPPCTADPCPSYGPDTAVDQVIELRGGRAAELNVKVGDRIEIEFLPQQTKF
jgi:uncharacterized membrane protein (UPF0127 family)